ncbi:MAG: hypothetical protein J7604_12305 [Sporocytophaga sp.]|uniref:hypothetical protein n=1 Tax=Sporocytophaga sp. TaxID=2231183 RepID=UPI001B27EC76|nr:hypothetical protein [Sporocytophaga sp.]MBO9700986.1 hypothetical protein [Sporocytophaga sp.]
MYSREVKSIVRHLGIVFPILFLFSCKSSKLSSIQELNSNCNQQNLYNYTVDNFPEPFYNLKLDTALVGRFSEGGLKIANAIGIIDLLTDYVEAEKRYNSTPSIENKINILDLDRKLSNAIQRASLEISAVASEIDCEEERADQISYYLKKREDDRETKLTVAAISVGAIATIASGILFATNENNDMEYVVEVGGSIAEAILGFMIFTSKPKVEFYHPRNHLEEIWNGKETSLLFPAHVWYYFNYYNPKKPEEPSLRVQILKGWKAIYEWEEKESKHKQNMVALFFGKGGQYTSESLKARARMLDQLQANITLMKQDLTKLATYLEKE